MYNMKKTKVPVQQQGFFIYNVNQSQEACTKPETAKLKEFIVFFGPLLWRVFNQAEW